MFWRSRNRISNRRVEGRRDAAVRQHIADALFTVDEQNPKEYTSQNNKRVSQKMDLPPNDTGIVCRR